MVQPSRAVELAAPPRDERPTIVFLHSTRLSGAEWAAQIAALGADFHCLTPDLPGHGAAAEVPFTLAGATARIAGLIEREAHGGRAIVVGLSLGGYVAMALAAAWPERVAGLLISGATAEPIGPRAVAYRALALAYGRLPRSLLDRASRRFIAWRYPPRIAEPILATGFSFAGGAVAVRALIGERFIPRLAAYPGPTLVVNGEYDVFFRSAERSFTDAAGDARRVILRRATHYANLDQPEGFSAAIRAFATRIG